ncbi:hypothetical protein ACVXZ0_15170 [Staphylococcus aureus]
MKASKYLLREAEEKYVKIVEAGLQEKRIEWSEIKKICVIKLVNYYSKIQNRPMIIPVISEI